MSNNDFFRRSQEALQRYLQRPADEQIQRLIDKGVIDEQGKVQSWNSFLAITAVKPETSGKRISAFRCLKPWMNMPGTAEIDVTRESMINYVRQGKLVVTATLDQQKNRWIEREKVHLTSNGFLRTDANETEEDNIGELPKFVATTSKL